MADRDDTDSIAPLAEIGRRQARFENQVRRAYREQEIMLKEVRDGLDLLDRRVQRALDLVEDRQAMLKARVRRLESATGTSGGGEEDRLSE